MMSGLSPIHIKHDLTVVEAICYDILSDPSNNHLHYFTKQNRFASHSLTHSFTHSKISLQMHFSMIFPDFPTAQQQHSTVRLFRSMSHYREDGLQCHPIAHKCTHFFAHMPKLVYSNASELILLAPTNAIRNMRSKIVVFHDFLWLFLFFLGLPSNFDFFFYFCMSCFEFSLFFLYFFVVFPFSSPLFLCSPLHFPQTILLLIRDEALYRSASSTFHTVNKSMTIYQQAIIEKKITIIFTLQIFIKIDHFISMDSIAQKNPIEKLLETKDDQKTQAHTLHSKPLLLLNNMSCVKQPNKVQIIYFPFLCCRDYVSYRSIHCIEKNKYIFSWLLVSYIHTPYAAPFLRCLFGKV